MVSTRSVVERGVVWSEVGVGSAMGATPMTGRPTGEVEAGSAESAEVAETADGLGAAGSCWTTAVGGSLGGSVTVEAWSRLPTGGGEPGAASVMTPILRGVPV